MLVAPFGQIRDINTVSMQEVELRSMQHVNGTYLGSHLMLCKILTRYKLFVDARDIGVAANILMDGFWESWITKFIVNTVQPGSICIDAGANFGYYSLVMAELAGHNGRVIAVEPNSYLCRLMSHTNKVNEFHYEIVRKALSDTPAIISILQTTDVHCQIHPHDELFWENNKAVFRKTGGYAYLASMLKNLKKKNPITGFVRLLPQWK